MMRGPSYDDAYISRKLSSFQSQPTYAPPPPPPSYGRYMQAYPPMGPPRLPPRMVPVPSYYDYDYPYAGGYGGYTSYLPPPVPRMSRYDAYLDDDLDVAYQPRYRPRVADSLDAIDTREKSAAMTGGEVAQLEELRLPRAPKGAQSKEAAGGGRGGQRALPPSSDPHALGAAEDNKRLHRLSVRYPSLSDAQMLQDHVDKMRIRLKSLAYSLDPTGPVPEIVIPGRSKRSESAEPSKKYSMGLDYAEMPRLSTRKQRYYPEDEHMKDNLRIKCLSHYKTTRNAAGYCKAKQYVGGEVLPETYTGSYKSKYSSTKWEEPDTVFSGPSDKKPFSKVELGSSFFSTYGYTSRKKDTVAEKVRDYYYAGDGPYKAITDVPTEDTKAEEEPKEEKKERRKKKKSKERDEAPAALEASAEAASAAAAASPAPATESEPAPVEEAPKVEAEPAAPAPAPTAAADAPPAEEEVLDEKERKKLEKKRRKAEREAAAKAAMEAELAALAAAEAELARLEAESASIKVDAAPSEPAAPAEAAPAATTEAAPEAKSESAADK